MHFKSVRNQFVQTKSAPTGNRNFRVSVLFRCQVCDRCQAFLFHIFGNSSAMLQYLTCLQQAKPVILYQDNLGFRNQKLIVLTTVCSTASFKMGKISINNCQIPRSHGNFSYNESKYEELATMQIFLVLESRQVLVFTLKRFLWDRSYNISEIALIWSQLSAQKTWLEGTYSLSGFLVLFSSR